MLKQMIEYGIGLTPMLEVGNIHNNHILIKLEQTNYLGSIKARTAYGMISGLNLPTNVPIIESSSGNLGIALDFFCREEHRDFICLIDETIVPNKLARLKELGINFIVVPEELGFDGRDSRIRYARKLADNGHHWINQYDNEDGVSIHRETTGVEIFEQTQGRVTCCVCAVGSGGTISGVGEFLKSRNPGIRMIAAEPYGSTIFSTCESPYMTAGAGFKGKPGNVVRHSRVVDGHFAVPDSVSVKKCKELKQRLGVCVGITTGMAYAAAEDFCSKNSGETVVVISSDGGELYSECQ